MRITALPQVLYANQNVQWQFWCCVENIVKMILNRFALKALFKLCTMATQILWPVLIDLMFLALRSVG